jgi:hypothetical protein
LTAPCPWDRLEPVATAVVRATATASLCALLGIAACKQQPEPPGPSSAAPTEPAVPSAAPEPEQPWFVGTWEGRFRTEAHRVDLDRKRGAPREWDDGKDPRCVGDVTLSVEVDEAGAVRGDATGALGSIAVQGMIEGEDLRVRLSPTDTGAFHGSLVARHEDEALVGELRASSGDSFELCKATVRLARKP